MLNPTTVLSEALSDYLANYYRGMFGPAEPTYPTLLTVVSRIVIERIANSDALYHDVNHTMLVTQVGQEILRGRHLTREVTPQDWLHVTVALLCHDIGYVRGICRGDTATTFVVDDRGTQVTPPRGASDAWLTPWHVERSKLFVHERLGPLPFLDAERIARAIEHTRFPVPDGTDGLDTGSEGALVRAADLIGQLADPNYPRKLTHLYHEFVETGTAARLGYDSAADLLDQYPKFYWGMVQPYITDAIACLQLTQEGKQWIANLYSHVFAVEHDQYRFGPHRGPVAGAAAKA